MACNTWGNTTSVEYVQCCAQFNAGLFQCNLNELREYMAANMPAPTKPKRRRAYSFWNINNAEKLRQQNIPLE